jgi:hypothetical protein
MPTILLRSVTLLAAGTASLLLLASGTTRAPAASLDAGSVTPASARTELLDEGATLGGLRLGAPGGVCAGLYEVVGTGRCTHGTDDPPSAAVAADQDARTASADAPLSSSCGSSGKRVQAIYARAADVPSRYYTVKSTLLKYVRVADSVFYYSARETGGVRHIRFVTDSRCTPVIANVKLSRSGDDTFANTIRELQAKGFNRSDRAYMVWVDANKLCGQGTVWNDDRDSTNNRNNRGPSYGRTDRGC